MSGPQNLADAVLARRLELGVETHSALAAAAGLSRRVIQSVESAERVSYRPATLAKLDGALGWSLGASRDLLAGGDTRPAEISHEEIPQRTARPPRRLAAGRRFYSTTGAGAVDVLPRDPGAVVLVFEDGSSHRYELAEILWALGVEGRGGER